MDHPRVGLVGLGNLGKPMGHNLLKKGFPLTVYDVRPEPVLELGRADAAPATSPRDVAARSDIVLTVVPESQHVRDVYFGPDGVIEGLTSASIVVEMSTIDPTVTKEVASAVTAKGARMIDAAIGKTALQAVDGTLTFMVGGDPAVLEVCRPVLLAMGTTIFHCGPIGSGVTTKLVNNLVSCTITLSVAEALVLGAKAGLNTETMLEVLMNTGAQNFQLDVTYRNKALRGEFDGGFRLALAHKDVGLALNLANAVGTAIPLGGLGRELYALAKARGLGDLDFSSYMKVLEEAAGVEVRFERADEPA